MILLSLDPGRTTGYAEFVVCRRSARLVAAGEFPVWSDLEGLIRRAHLVVYERAFVSSLAFDPIPFEVVGVIKFLAERYRKAVVRQQPEAAKGVARWGDFFNFSFSRHARDAVYHGVSFLVHQRSIQLEKIQILSTENS